jgi:hypothetical protein
MNSLPGRQGHAALLPVTPVQATQDEPPGGLVPDIGVFMIACASII